MAEEFISEIYSRAELLYIYRQCVDLLYIRDLSKFSKMWSAKSDMILEIINDIMQTDEAQAARLETMVYSVINNVNDIMLMIELIDGGIIPILYQYMRNYCGIDVTEGEWQLKSSRSGYLTMYNVKQKCHVHSLDNPMWEARAEAKALYDGKQDRALLFGAGLGYMAKALWEISEHSLDIYIYENNKKIEEYAHRYGVIDDIDADKLHYIVKEDIVDLYCDFCEMQLTHSNNLIVIQDWMVENIDEPIQSDIKNQIMSNWALISFQDNYRVNYWRNKKRFTGELSEIAGKHKEDEFIVVAAGPSLDESIGYIKENVGKKIIVCVNTVLKRLLNEGIKPDYACLIDPTVGVFKHVEGIEELTEDIPLIAESVAYWKFLDVYKGPIYRVIGANYTESIDEAYRINADITDIGSTVANLVIEVAVQLGAAKIEITGMDLSFPGDKLYAGDKSVHGENKYQDEFFVKSVDGGTVRTVDTYNIFRSDIEKQIFKYSGVEFENLSSHGALINGCVSGEWRKVSLCSLIKEKNIISDGNYKVLLRIIGLLPDVVEGYKQYPACFQDAEFKEFLNKSEREAILHILNVWHKFAQSINDSSATIFLDTVILEIEHNEDIMNELINLIVESPMDYKRRYFWYCQIKEKRVSKKAYMSDNAEKLLNILKNAIIEEISEKLSLKKDDSSKEEIENNTTIIFVDGMSTADKNNSSSAISAAVSAIDNGRQVLLINTAEKFPIGVSVPIYCEVSRSNDDDAINTDKIEVNGKVIPYFQCESCMPDIANIKLMLEYIRKANPSEVISFSEDSPLVWMIEQLL